MLLFDYRVFTSRGADVLIGVRGEQQRYTTMQFLGVIGGTGTPYGEESDVLPSVIDFHSHRKYSMMIMLQYAQRSFVMKVLVSLHSQVANCLNESSSLTILIRGLPDVQMR